MRALTSRMRTRTNVFFFPNRTTREGKNMTQMFILQWKFTRSSSSISMHFSSTRSNWKTKRERRILPVFSNKDIVVSHQRHLRDESQIESLPFKLLFKAAECISKKEEKPYKSQEHRSQKKKTRDTRMRFVSFSRRICFVLRFNRENHHRC